MKVGDLVKFKSDSKNTTYLVTSGVYRSDIYCNEPRISIKRVNDGSVAPAIRPSSLEVVKQVKVGDLVRHTATDTSFEGCVGIVTDISQTLSERIYGIEQCLYPTVTWSDGRITSPQRQYLEVISESR